MTDQKKIVKKVSRVGILGNVALSAFKLYAGIFGKSWAMISDAIHSLSDVLATLIAFVGVLISGRSADKEHPYGHERYECVASLFLGCLLIATAFGIGITGARNIITGNYENLAVPTALPLAAAIISIVSKELMFHYTMHYAKIMDSSAFAADAWHHRSDAISSVGSFIGIAFAKMGFPIMDSVAELVICICILKVGIDIVRDSLDRMMDASCSADYEAQLQKLIVSNPGVEKIDMLHTRKFGSKIYVDAEIAVDRNSTLIAAHKIAEDVHTAVEQAFPNVKHIMIHVNPAEEKAA